MDKGVTVYLPMVDSIRKWKDRKKKIRIPLFNSYVFVCINLKDRYTALQTDGVVRIISFSGEPAVIPDWQIQQLKQLIEIPDAIQLESYFNAGDWVEITEGPFIGVKGRLKEMRGETRLVVNIDGIMQSVSVVVDPTTVRKIEPVVI